MQILLEAIKFNHDPTSATSDALNIRKNEFELVTVPEWRRGVTTSADQSQAAYAIDETRRNEITIKAKFRRVDPNIETVEIQAKIAAHEDHGVVLGDLKPRSISFVDGDETEYECFVIKDPGLHKVGVSNSVVEWSWQYRVRPSKTWDEFETTRHRIYVVLNSPTCPWVQQPFDSTNTQLPWADLLREATNWATGAKSDVDAATKITFAVRDLERHIALSYVPAPAFYSEPNFDATSFLNLLRGGVGKGHKLNCSDCATVVSSFANILGCNLSQALMGWNFDTNPVLPIGKAGWRTFSYNYHEVAWQDPFGVDSEVFDACLKLDRDRCPSEEPHPAFQPANLKFGRPGQRLYRFRLAAPPGQQIHPESPMPKGGQRRRIAPNREGSKRAHPELFELLALHYRYSEWQKVERASEQLFLPRLYLSPNNFPRWHMLEPIEITTTTWPPTTQSLWTSSHNSEMVRFDSFACDTHEDARRFLMEVLTQFQRPTLERLDDIGDVAFIERERDAIAMALSNLVVLIRNAGRVLVDLFDLAITAQSELKSYPIHQNFYEEEHYLPESDDNALAPVLTPNIEVGRIEKIFTEKGRILRKNGELSYQPLADGPHVVHIFGTDQNGRPRHQQLIFPANSLS